MGGWRGLALEPICWPCCCACLPVLGLLKGIIICLPCAIAPSLVCFVMAVVLLPHDVAYTYYTFATTPRLGPTIKFFFLLLLPIPLICWPPLVLLGVFFGALIYALGGPVLQTFTEEDSPVITAGVATTVGNCFIKAPKEFWQFNMGSYFSYLRDYRAPLHANEKPFDVPIYWIPYGLFLALLGVLVALPTAIVIGVIKFFPALLRAYYEVIKVWVKASIEVKVLSFPFWLLALALVPVGVIVGVMAFICTGIFMGITPPGAAYRRGPIAGFRRIVNNIYELDRLSNQIVFEWNHSCMSCFDLGEDFF